MTPSARNPQHFTGRYKLLVIGIDKDGNAAADFQRSGGQFAPRRVFLTSEQIISNATKQEIEEAWQEALAYLDRRDFDALHEKYEASMDQYRPKVPYRHVVVGIDTPPSDP